MSPDKSIDEKLEEIYLAADELFSRGYINEGQYYIYLQKRKDEILKDSDT
jgi:hypothetical protein